MSFVYYTSRDDIENLGKYEIYVVSTLKIMSNPMYKSMVMSAHPNLLYMTSTGRNTYTEVTPSVFKNIKDAIENLCDSGHLRSFTSKKKNGSYLVNTNNIFSYYKPGEYVTDTYEAYNKIFRSDYTFIKKIYIYSFWMKLLALMSTKDKCCWYSLSTIADKFELSVPSVSKYLSILEKLQVIYIHHQGNHRKPNTVGYMPTNVIGRFEDKSDVIEKGKFLAS